MYVILIPYPRPKASNMDWLEGVVDAGVAVTHVPPISEGMGRYQVVSRPELDVRTIPEPSFAWVEKVVEAKLPPQPPGKGNGGKPPKPPKKNRLTWIDYPDTPQIITWAFPVIDQDIAVRFIPPLYETLQRFRVDERPFLDVRSIPEPQFSWASYVAQSVIIAGTPTPNPESYQVRTGAVLDVEAIPQPAFTWIDPVVDADIAKKVLPAVTAELRAFRVWEGDKLDVARVPEPQPLYPQSQILPGEWAPITAELQSFRVREREEIDVRRIPESEPIYYQQVLPNQWAPITAELQSFRVWEQPVLDVRNIPQTGFYPESRFIRTTQLIVEVVIRPHPPQNPIVPPPPLVFIGSTLFSITGPGLPMEVCSGYIGQPPIHTQLQQVRAHYTENLAPRTSQLHPVHTPNIGKTEKVGQPGVLNPQNSWFHLRQTDRYHRVCLVCEGETEVTGLTYQLREAGIR